MNQTTNHNPFLFAFGVPRSGTTLLQRMLNGHPELTVANDSHFIPRALERTDKSLIQRAERGLPIVLTPELAESVRNYHRFWRLGIGETEFEAIRNRSETYQELVSGLYEASARNSNKRLAGEKTPDYLRRVRLLNGLFPNAKLVHLIRDGRNVALSLLQWAKPDKGPGRIELWNEHPVAVCALWWRWLVMASREQSSAIGSATYVEVRYEDLVAEPARQMQDVCDFLGIGFSEKMLEYHEGKSKLQNQLSAKSAWLAPQTGLRNWKQDMDLEQIELFEALATDALHLYGYKLHCHSFSDRTLDMAKRCKDWWERYFLPRHRRPNNAATDQRLVLDVVHSERAV